MGEQVSYSFNNDWDEILLEEFSKDYYIKLKKFLNEEYKRATVYPPKEKVFNALTITPYSKVKVVILGQDPYHGKGQAHGLAFSVCKGVALPPSLQNMYKELVSDIGIKMPDRYNGCLEKWAEQGVLLLNASLTVRESEPNSHRREGWVHFTDEIIKKLNSRKKPVIFLLWGNDAQAKQALITGKQHYVLKATHPSPLSAHRGFFGCKHFSKVNKILTDLNEKPIDWQI